MEEQLELEDNGGFPLLKKNGEPAEGRHEDGQSVLTGTRYPKPMVIMQPQ